MSQTVWVTMGITAGVAIGWLLQLLFLRRRRSLANDSTNAGTRGIKARSSGLPTANSSPAAKSRPRAFHGVCLKPGSDACEAVRAVADRRYLSNDAPALPLAGCDQARCECTYGHYGDRRDAEDRRSGWGAFGGFAAPVAGGNRRSQRPDRRTTSDRKQG